jgi:uncharacterized protein (DUF983 family)
MSIHCHEPKPVQARDWRQAVRRGLLGRCPHCGRGKLFRAFLKPVDSCAACGESLHHQRADDLPPYIVITIVGHVVVGGILLAEKYSNWSMALHLWIWPALTILLSLALMQPAKGAVIGLQWALRMHGFGGAMPKGAEHQPAMKAVGGR